MSIGKPLPLAFFFGCGLDSSRLRPSSVLLSRKYFSFSNSDGGRGVPNIFNGNPLECFAGIGGRGFHRSDSISSVLLTIALCSRDERAEAAWAASSCSQCSLLLDECVLDLKKPNGNPPNRIRGGLSLCPRCTTFLCCFSRSNSTRGSLPWGEMGPRKTGPGGSGSWSRSGIRKCMLLWVSCK
jgi:hypothetical protein